MTSFQQGYLDCAVWASIDDDGTPLDSIDAELTDAARATLLADAADFEATYRALLDEANALGYPDDALGGDFWLTRNHHGAGFWDRRLGNVGRALTDAAHAYGSADLIVGDDGTVHHA